MLEEILRIPSHITQMSISGSHIIDASKIYELKGENHVIDYTFWRALKDIYKPKKSISVEAFDSYLEELYIDYIQNEIKEYVHGQINIIYILVCVGDKKLLSKGLQYFNYKPHYYEEFDPLLIASEKNVVFALDVFADYFEERPSEIHPGNIKEAVLNAGIVSSSSRFRRFISNNFFQNTIPSHGIELPNWITFGFKESFIALRTESFAADSEYTDRLKSAIQELDIVEGIESKTNCLTSLCKLNFSSNSNIAQGLILTALETEKPSIQILSFIEFLWQENTISLIILLLLNWVVCLCYVYCFLLNKPSKSTSKLVDILIICLAVAASMLCIIETLISIRYWHLTRKLWRQSYQILYILTLLEIALILLKIDFEDYELYLSITIGYLHVLGSLNYLAFVGKGSQQILLLFEGIRFILPPTTFLLISIVLFAGFSEKGFASLNEKLWLIVRGSSSELEFNLYTVLAIFVIAFCALAFLQSAFIYQGITFSKSAERILRNKKILLLVGVGLVRGVFEDADNFGGQYLHLIVAKQSLN